MESTYFVHYSLSEIRFSMVMVKYWLILIEHLLRAKHCAKADNNCMDSCYYPEETETWTCPEVDRYQMVDTEFNP